MALGKVQYLNAALKRGARLTAKIKTRGRRQNKDKVAITLRKFCNDLDVSMVRAGLFL